MKVSNHSNAKWVWLFALLLFVFVAATAVVVVDRLDNYLLDDSGAISLLGAVTPQNKTDSTAPEDTVTDPASTELPATGKPQEAEETELQPPATEEPETRETDPEPATLQQTSPQPTSPTDPSPAPTSRQEDTSFRPGFEAGDEKGVWDTQTQVDIFRISYENNDRVVTVNSDNGAKLIAPGTENSYTFKLKNTGNVALDYTVELDAYITPADIYIPIRGRLSRYDGTWIVGDRDRYETVSVLDTASDKATLGAGKYTYYTLDWQWPFESGDDAWDTHLGNLAVNQDLVFTIVIKTTAEANTDPSSGGGITPPYTGDDSNMTLWIALAVGSFVVLLLLLFTRSGEKKQHDTAAGKR